MLYLLNHESSGNPLQMRKRDKLKFAIFISLCLTASFLIPLSVLVLGNMYSLASLYIDALLLTIFVCLVCFSVFYFINLFFYSSFYKKIILLIAYLIVFSSFLNTFFVPNSLSIADGIEMVCRKEAAYVLFLVLLLLLYFMFLRDTFFLRTNKIFKLLTKLIISVSIFLTVYTLKLLPKQYRTSSLIHILFSNQKAENIVLGKKNVFILTFDQAQGSFFKGFFESKKGKLLANKLDGFSFFPNAVTTFPTTNFSLPSILLSRPVSNRSENFFKVRASKKTFYSSLSEKGITTSIYYQSAHKFGNKNRYFPIIAKISSAYLYVLNNAFGLKLNFFGSSIYTFPLFMEYAYQDDVHLWHNLSDHLSINKKKEGAVVFIHFYFSHQPYMVNSDCTMYSRKKISEKKFSIGGLFDTTECISRGIVQFVNGLKKMGIYENTTLFIAGDHGSSSDINTKHKEKYKNFFHEYSDFLPHAHTFPLGRYNPLFLYKGEKANHPFKIKDEVVSLVDIGPTICDIMNCDFQEERNWTGVSLKKTLFKSRKHDFWMYHGFEGGKRFFNFLEEDWSKVQASSLEELKKKMADLSREKINNQSY